MPFNWFDRGLSLKKFCDGPAGKGVNPVWIPEPDFGEGVGDWARISKKEGQAWV